MSETQGGLFRRRGGSRRRLVVAALPVAVLLVIAGARVAGAAGQSVTISAGGCSDGSGGSLFCYAPSRTVAVAGDTVSWSNASGVAHTVTLCTASTCPGAPASSSTCDSFNLGVAAPNGSSTYHTFEHPGTCVYYCTIHGYALMHGEVQVMAPVDTFVPGPTPTLSSAPSSPASASPSASPSASASPEASPSGPATPAASPDGFEPTPAPAGTVGSTASLPPPPSSPPWAPAAGLVLLAAAGLSAGLKLRRRTNLRG